MDRKGALLACCFCAGLMGALLASLGLWVAGQWSLTAAAGVRLAPEWSLHWLYPRLLHGGLWGLLYYPTVASPRRRRHWIRKGLWIALLPCAYTLLHVYPKAGLGLLGLQLGNLTPLVILLAWLLWGMGIGFFTRLFWGR
jgi:hypothetical protein